MYDIRQFKPALYALLILGFSGFALAAQTPGLWVLSTLLTLFNLWLIRTGRFVPMPRWMANLVTIGSVVYIVSEIRAATAVPIVLIGQFLVLLQLVKIFEQRANRDYAQLLVLSLLLVVAGAINTSELLFGLLFIAYLFLSLYCCLLFHLKVETDHARAALGVRDEKINPATFRQDQRYLPTSMRRLTGLVAGLAVAMAVGVFMFFPRGAGANWLVPLQLRQASITGFSDEVSFQNIARIAQNDEIAARVKVWHNGQPVRGGTILLRGNVHTDYSGASGSWKWSRPGPTVETYLSVAPDTLDKLTSNEETTDVWEQEISLEPHSLMTLFAMPGVTSFGKARELRRIKYLPVEDVLASEESINQKVQYTVVSTNATYFSGPARLRGTIADPDAPARTYFPARTTAMRITSDIDPRITEMARLPQVSGSDARGPLANRRTAGAIALPIDEQIASNIEYYLRSNYRYTLDLTDARNLIEGQDPLVAFLYDVKRGHCEYFAGAMTLMCQSLGMQARLVVGFRCDNYNQPGGYFMVQQSHAHAWVEVLTPRGWRAFDPTSGNEADRSQARGGWQKMKQYFDYLEFLWATTVIGYDRDSRDNMIQNLRNLDSQMTNALINTNVDAREMKRTLNSWFSETNFLLFSSKLLSLLIYLSVVTLVGAIGWFFFERWQLRKRARRIGLESLPTVDKVRLARQLGFYDELLQLLARHQIERHTAQTPREFAESLAFLPAQAYDLVHRLTDLYYQIRYGGEQLSPQRRGKVRKSLEDVGVILRKSVRPQY